MVDSRISIVLPLYNKELSVSKSVQSVLEQSHAEFELIIVDDGSTDTSRAVVEQIDDQRIVLVSQENRGVSAARNRGMQLAKNELVAFIDADDLWHRDYLTTIVKLHEIDPQCVCYTTAWAPWSVNNKLEQTSTEFQADKVRRMDYFAESMNDVAAHICSTVVKRAAALKIGGFPNGVKFLEDQDFCGRLAVSGDFIHYPQPLVYYVRDAENRACDRRSVQDMPPFFKECEPMMIRNHERDTQNWYLKEWLVSRYLSEVSLAAQTPGERKRALKFLWVCRKTVKSKMRWYKAAIYMLVPPKMLLGLIGIISSKRRIRAEAEA